MIKSPSWWSRTAALAALVTALGCAATRPAVHVASVSHHDDSAAALEREAQRREVLYDPHAREHRERCARHEVRADWIEPCWTSVVNPTEAHLRAAAQHRELAAAHRAASQSLRDAEARACAGLDPDDLAESPLEHAQDITSVTPLADSGQTTGARVVFRPVEGLDASSLRRLVGCHLARNTALGHDVPEMPTCPLVPRGARATVEADPSGSLTVTIRSEDAEAAREIVRRAQRWQPQQ